MGSWTVPKSLLSLRDEIDFLNPKRDKGAEGTIGDAAHRSRSSDHNPDDTPGSATPGSDADHDPEVHALDVDSTGPWPSGWSLQRIVSIVVRAHHEERLHVLQNIIYDRTIWSESWGWTARVYGGADPHTNHAHFSARYGSGSTSSNPENFAGPWGIRAARQAELEDEMTPEELLKYDPNDKSKGVENTFTDAATNPTIAVRTALRYASRAIVAEKYAQQALAAVLVLEDNVAKLNASLGTLRAPAAVALTDAQLSTLADAVVAKLTGEVELGFRPAT